MAYTLSAALREKKIVVSGYFDKTKAASRTSNVWFVFFFLELSIYYPDSHQPEEKNTKTGIELSLLPIQF